MNAQTTTVADRPDRPKKRPALSFKKTTYSEYDAWLNFYPKIGLLCFKVSWGSYFDERVQINSHLTTVIAIFGLCLQPLISLWFLPVWLLLLAVPFGHFFLNLPLYTGISDCETPEYGFYLYSERPWIFDSFWLCIGEKKICFDMPWSWDWYRTSALKKDGTWEHDKKGASDRKHFFDEKWLDTLWCESYPYKYVLKSGVVQERIATIKLEEREWRWKALMWLPHPARTRKTIAVAFDDEVGEESGSWKGGCIGCSYEMHPGETPEQTLRRMEVERKF